MFESSVMNELEQDTEQSFLSLDDALKNHFKISSGLGLNLNLDPVIHFDNLEDLLAWNSKQKSIPQNFNTEKCEGTKASRNIMRGQHNNVGKHNMFSQKNCPNCPEKFLDSKDLRKHTLEKHFEGKLFKCGSCGKDFRRQYHLQRHRENVHKPVKLKNRPTSPSEKMGILNENGSLLSDLKSLELISAFIKEVDEIVGPTHPAALEVVLQQTDDQNKTAVAEPEAPTSSSESENSPKAFDLILRSVDPKLHDKFRNFLDVVPKNEQGVHRRGGVLDQLIDEWVKEFFEGIIC